MSLSNPEPTFDLLNLASAERHVLRALLNAHAAAGAAQPAELSTVTLSRAIVNSSQPDRDLADVIGALSTRRQLSGFSGSARELAILSEWTTDERCRMFFKLSDDFCDLLR